LQQLLIFPYSGTALEALDCLSDDQECIGFISDNEDHINKTFFGINVYSRDAITRFPSTFVLIVNGSPTSFKNRKSIIESLKIEDNRLISVIHPSANIGKFVKIGKNVLIMGGVTITSNARVDDHVCILSNSSVHHDTTIGAYTLIASGVTISGNVDVGENCYIGAGSCIKNNVRIAKRVLIGSGSNVVKNLEENDAIVKGNPAK
jgi:acetyltransferase EpsM